MNVDAAKVETNGEGLCVMGVLATRLLGIESSSPIKRNLSVMAHSQCATLYITL